MSGLTTPPGEQTMLVSILNWNGTEDTIICLQGIDRAAAKQVRFAVLDNGSQIDPSDTFKRLFPDVELVRVPQNLGFTGGHNHMIRLAIERGYKSVLILNSDCKIDIQSIVELQITMDSDPQIAAVSSLVYRDEPVRRALMVAGWIDWGKHLSVRPSDPDALAPANCPTLLVGTSVLLRCSALQKIGPLDDRYFAYYEDNDLSARIAAAGYRAVYCRLSICLHRYKPLHEYGAMALYLLARNAWLFWTTHTPVSNRAGLFRTLLSQLLHDIALLKKNNAPQDKIFALIDGFWDGLWKRFGPPPPTRHSPALLRSAMTAAPYFLSQFVLQPWLTLKSKLRPTRR